MAVYQIKEPVKVSNNGDFIDCEVIEIAEPNMLNLGAIAKLKDVLGKGMRNVATMANENKQAPDDTDEDTNFITQLIVFGIVEEYSLAFKDFLKLNGRFAIDDETKIALKGQVDNLDLEDFTNMMSEYSKDFLLKDLLGN